MAIPQLAGMPVNITADAGLASVSSAYRCLYQLLNGEMVTLEPPAPPLSYRAYLPSYIRAYMLVLQVADCIEWLEDGKTPSEEAFFRLWEIVSDSWKMDVRREVDQVVLEYKEQFSHVFEKYLLFRRSFRESGWLFENTETLLHKLAGRVETVSQARRLLSLMKECMLLRRMEQIGR